MADRNSYRITARAEGKGQKTFDFGEKTLHINAAENTVYQIEEVGMSSIPDNIVFSRKGNDLWIMPEGQETPQAIIEGYFSAKNISFGAMGVDGSLYSYGIEELKTVASAPNLNTVEHTLSSEVAPATAAESGSSTQGLSGISIPVISTAAIALGGIAVAAGSGSHSSSDDKSRPNNKADNKTTGESASADENAMYADNRSSSQEVKPLGDIEAPQDETETNPVAPAKSAFVDVTHLIEIDHKMPTEHLSQETKQDDPNHAPHAPEFVHLGNIVQGKAQAGDVIANVHAHDPDNDQLRYYLDDHTGLYAINSTTGEIILTAAGAAAINAGQGLPDLKVFSDDGHKVSSTSVLKFNLAETHYQSSVNHAPEQLTFHDSATSFVKGQAQVGDKVTTVSARDAENEHITYYLQGSSRDIYEINHETGVVTLTQAGADWVNAGNDLPDVEVIAYDGHTTSNIAYLDVADTSATAPVESVLATSPVESENVDLHSHDLPSVEKPYFIDISEHDLGNFSYVHNIYSTSDNTYYIDSYGDQVSHTSGIDAVYSSIDYTLGWGLENLYLTGKANLSGTGNHSDNLLWGNAGDNHLSGGYGDDTLYGGAGDDVLSGGAGRDTFMIDGLGIDTLLDFNTREGDIIQLASNVFINLDLGRVSTDNFVYGVNAHAKDHNDHLLYNTVNNTLYYDADGSGSQAAVAIAKFADHLNDEITANSFRVF